MRIGRYEVIGELGRGGMGSVSLAKSPGGELVVLKRPLEDDPDLSERLRDEARVGLRLSHPSVVETLDLFEHEGRPVLVVSYVSGASMYDLRQKGPLAIGAICRVGRQIADALDALHHATDERGESLGMLHRDVTPGNIMLGHDGNARLIDLGIARSNENRAAKTRTGFMRGTLRYLAPELFDNKDYSPASDLWSLGLVLLEAALGRQVFRGTDAEIVGKIISGRALDLLPDEKLEPRFFKAIAGLLKQKPQDRPRRARDAAAVFAMLEKEYGDTGIVASEAVFRAVGPPRTYDGGSSALETRLLITRAAATFCADDDRLVGDEETVADDGSLPDRSDIYSAETHLEPRGLGSQPPQLELTGVVEGSVGYSHTAGFRRVPRTPGEELLQYAAQLRDFERSSKTGSTPRPVGAEATQHTPPTPDPAALLPVLEPLNGYEEPPTPTTAGGRAQRVPPPGPLYDEWASLPPTVVEAHPEASSSMRVVRALPEEPSEAVRVARRGWPVLVAVVIGMAALSAAVAMLPSVSDPMTASPATASAGPMAREAPDDVVEAAPAPEDAPAAPSELSSASPSPESAEGEEEPPVEEGEHTPTMPDCWVPGHTRLFAYQDARGTWVAARLFTQVPKRYRASVRCVE